MPVLPHGSLQLALRACNTGTIIRTITGQYYKALGPIRGHPESNGPRASPRYLANPLFPSNNHSTTLLLSDIQCLPGRRTKYVVREVRYSARVKFVSHEGNYSARAKCAIARGSTRPQDPTEGRQPGDGGIRARAHYVHYDSVES